MSLAKYKQKRSFNQTPEPEGGRAKKGELRFVIQKHDASHLHYDFRLEMDGVLKSWAVPKGPSTDPEVKRLAMMVEDHPYDYRNFEGIIPKGNYGAGTVIVWDQGTYLPDEDVPADKKSQEKSLLKQLNAGTIKFTLKGKKLKGSYALVKMYGKGENTWLLIKHKDKYASTADITEKDKSVISNKTIEKIAATSENIWHSNKTAATKKTATKKSSDKKSAPTKTAAKKNVEEDVEVIGDASVNEMLEKGKKQAFPKDIKPMLATRVEEAFDNKDWLYEIKWDGYRALAYMNKGKVELRSRNNLSFTQKFATIADALKDEWQGDAVIDGEIVALNDEGLPDFQNLQSFVKNGKTARLAFYVFDILWYSGKLLTALPLIERKTILQNLVPQSDVIIFSDHIIGDGKAFFKLALKKGLEGVMAKDMQSEYYVDHRSKSWLKIKNTQKLEAIICGFTEPRKSRKHFGAIILGKYNGNKLEYIGHSGSGFTEKTLKDLHQKLQPLVAKKPPFDTVPKTNMPVTWVKPQLVCEVTYTEWTQDRVLRHPIFLGLREDKKAATEKNEKVVAAPKKKPRKIVAN
ncbi:non-homologous end-joining DNA ligase [Pinibacter aurantiacus]|uniref:DNA ligase (ATP) n=1 Tax=Pinibacter aurantiacus TaxID=2851599 RepID=A0A9E2SAI6_9BACT|nr:non-homologous end-joining DNA ligase [Pinibacter aurantiacus]MBV4358976.1 non-homologous end-joining DNA ligase [Pinibacter aurantiacus]